MELNYNQAVFGLMLMGAKADGKLQEGEKQLIVELTSDDHHLNAEEYKYVITLARQSSDADFKNIVFSTLNKFSQLEKIKALYRMLQLIKADESSNNDPENKVNLNESSVYEMSLQALHIKAEEVEAYGRTKV